MDSITVSDLRKSYGKRARAVRAVKSVSFEVRSGEMLVLLGPSGCGKTTTLRCLAGLERPDVGQIEFGERVIYSDEGRIDVAIHRRDIGLVFQSFALWPHLSARRNIELPLRTRHAKKPDRVRLVNDMAAKVELTEELLALRPGELSGGQQQRVALARALVAQPSVVLFDEPLSNLDALLREGLRLELREMHRELGFTGVYVTHDLSEALALGDRVAVMIGGTIEQIGTPEDVFERPATRDVARVLGLRRVCRFGELTACAGAELNGTKGPLGSVDLSTAEVYCRPQRLQVGRSSQTVDGCLALAEGTVAEVAYVGAERDGLVEGGGRRLRTFSPLSDSLPRVGESVAIWASPSDVRLYDEASGRLCGASGASGGDSDGFG